jgi:hypothetical protein
MSGTLFLVVDEISYTKSMTMVRNFSNTFWKFQAPQNWDTEKLHIDKIKLNDIEYRPN